jgi:hypothetical protein
VATPSGFAIAYQLGSENTVRVREFKDGAWSPRETAVSGVSGAQAIHLAFAGGKLLAGASDGSGNGKVSVKADGTWGGPLTLTSSGSVAGSGDTFAIIDDDGVRIHSSAGWGATTPISGLGGEEELRGAAHGYLALGTSSTSWVANHFDGSTWSPQLALGNKLGSRPAILSDGAQWWIATAADGDVKVIRSVGADWSAPEVIDASASPASSPAVAKRGNDLVVAWTQDAILHVRTLRGGAWQPEQLPVQRSHTGGARDPVLATSAGAAFSVATWQQLSAGKWHVFASILGGGSWSIPTDLGEGRAPVATVNATAGVVFFIGPDAHSVRAARILPGGAEASVQVASLKECPTPTFCRSLLRPSSDLHLATSGSGFLAVWFYYHPSTSVGEVHWSKSADGASWTTPASAGTSFSATATLVPAGSDYVLVEATGAAQSARSYNGSTWSSVTTLPGAGGRGFPFAAGGPAAAFVPVIESESTVRMYLYSGGSWSNSPVSATSIDAVFAGPEGDGFAAFLVGLPAPGAGTPLYSSALARYSAGSWGSPIDQPQLRLDDLGTGQLHYGAPGRYLINNRGSVGTSENNLFGPLTWIGAASTAVTSGTFRALAIHEDLATRNREVWVYENFP